jgi:DNA-binding transcriptional ArsR family regulator
MDLKRATQGYSALSTDIRLSVLRLLARGPADGLAAGEIARKLDIPANSLSQQLALLSAAGLVKQERDGRNVFYRIDFDGIKWLIKFLALDCAAGNVKGVKIDA